MATEKPKHSRSKKTTPAIDLAGRQPPFSLEAEMCVLGSIMLMPDKCDELVSFLRPSDFYDEAHGKLYSHVMGMHSAGKKIDMALLSERLIAAGDYEQVGGAAELARIFTSVPNAAHAAYYAEIVHNKATTREIIRTCSEVLADAYRPDQEPNELLDRTEQKVFAIRDMRHANSLTAIDEVLQVAMDRLDARLRGEPQPGTIETGFTDLDHLTGGLHAKELVVLAARPGMGKTAFAMNITENVVLKTSKPALFVSLEMAAIELIERMLCSVARVNGNRLRNGTLKAEERKELPRVAGILSTVPLFIDDSPTRNVAEIAGTARRVMRLHGELALVVVDYLQLVLPENSNEPRQEQVANIARRLKGLARELNVPILCLSQLNRQVEETRNNRPKLSHLRESGAIEQDADVVMFVHRESYFSKSDDQENERDALIIVEKQRNGPTGDIELNWEREYTRFTDRAPERFNEFDDFTQTAGYQ